MGKTNRSDLREDESLAEEVRKYQCLYDKCDPGYKEWDRKRNAWKAVEEVLVFTVTKSHLLNQIVIAALLLPIFKYIAYPHSPLFTCTTSS